MTVSGKRDYRATGIDVAAAAGVSQATVSRALNGDPSVSEATRRRVLQAAAQLNYAIDTNASRLRSGRIGTLAVVVVCKPGAGEDAANPFSYTLLGAVCAAASQRGYETLVSFQAQTSSLFGRYEEQRRADGLIVIGTSQNQRAWAYFRELAQDGANLVCWGGHHDDLPFVRSDNVTGAALATAHLLEAGYRKIVCIGSNSPDQPQFIERREGYRRSMQEAGLPPRTLDVEDGLTRLEQGRRAADALIAGQESFDAIFAVCDEIALGCLQALREKGLAVPEDCGLIGFDGLPSGAQSAPPISSVQPDFAVAGQLLVEKVLSGSSEKARTASHVPVRVLPRQSSARGGRAARTKLDQAEPG